VIDPDDWSKISRAMIEDVIAEYVKCDDIDYVRLRWFYRRLAQVGHPGGIEVTLDNIEILTPCFGSICAYLASIQSIKQNEWIGIGSKLLKLVNLDEVKENEYFRLSILNLSSRNAEINHFKSLSLVYGRSDASARREILLAAKTSGAIDWLREFKENFDGMDQWWKMAYLYCLHDFPRDERKYFISRLNVERPFESVLANWAKRGA
jgi:hypothetical protein